MKIKNLFLLKENDNGLKGKLPMGRKMAKFGVGWDALSPRMKASLDDDMWPYFFEKGDPFEMADAAEANAAQAGRGKLFNRDRYLQILQLKDVEQRLKIYKTKFGFYEGSHGVYAIYKEPGSGYEFVSQWQPKMNGGKGGWAHKEAEPDPARLAKKDMDDVDLLGKDEDEPDDSQEPEMSSDKPTMFAPSAEKQAQSQHGYDKPQKFSLSPKKKINQFQSKHTKENKSIKDLFKLIENFLNEGSAKYVKSLPKKAKNQIAAKLYKLSPAYNGNEYVVVSMAYANGKSFGDKDAVSETAIFPADKSGKITSYDMIAGGVKGTPEQAFESIGYTIQEKSTDSGPDYSPDLF